MPLRVTLTGAVVFSYMAVWAASAAQSQSLISNGPNGPPTPCPAGESGCTIYSAPNNIQSVKERLKIAQALLPDGTPSRQQPIYPRFQRPPPPGQYPEEERSEEFPPPPDPILAETEQPKLIFRDFYIETESKPKGWAEQIGDAIRNPENVKVAGDVAEKFGFPREAPELTWKWYGLQADLIAPSLVSSNGEEEVGFFRSPPEYTFCNADLLDEPDIRQTTDHHVTYVSIARRLRNPDGLTSDDGLIYKIVIPRIADEQTWVKSHIRLFYIQADRQLVIRLTEEGKCVAHNMCPWVYERGEPKRTNVFTCNPNDTKRDRWADAPLEDFMRAIESAKPK